MLHGCTQTADAYDRGAAWTSAADRNGFALPFPQQQRANNPNLCFNWFSPRDARRDRGEAASIVQMVENVQTTYGTDASRVFVTGLSAGGAMAAVMLACYPDIFAGGAVIAGLPYGTANNVPQALERMRGQGMPEASGLGELARSASLYSGPRPSLSVWHGTDDATVSPINARALVDQWRQLHGGLTDARRETVRGHERYVSCDTTGRPMIEEHRVRGLGHGTPLSTREAGSAEIAGPHMLEAGISSTRSIIAFWGIGTADVDTSHAPKVERPEARSSSVDVPVGIKSTIEDALRAAGLLR